MKRQLLDLKNVDKTLSKVIAEVQSEIVWQQDVATAAHESRLGHVSWF